ncbi:hypothetical protein KFL_003250020 [Klebsormidium nitens]|uniref:Uncharacterized protein n=1 Tax=Klebsormidium nitens TaxID=105231 RepID=A0A1Y1I7S2_KLENI|nr:hypothetical protein KFL_003250020 [Klebsormidium nitens]|eukprot:GAQ87000.1 hypothetical protein KFL_003250020 [Klebsormidium nitens]
MSSTLNVLFLRAVLIDLFLASADKVEEFLAAGIKDSDGSWCKPMLAHYLYSMMDDLLRDTSSGMLGDTVVDPISGNLRAADVVFKDGDTISLESLVAALYRGTKQYLRNSKAPCDKISWPRTFGVSRCQELGQRGLLAAIEYFFARAKRDPALCRALLAYLDDWFSDSSARHCLIMVRARARACLNHLLGAMNDATSQAVDESSQSDASTFPADAGVDHDILQKPDFYGLDGHAWIEEYFCPPDDDRRGAAEALCLPTVPLQVNQPWSPFDMARDLVRNGHASVVLDNLGPIALDMVEEENAMDAVRDLEMQAACL